jgi:hypothetical protein
MAKRPNPNLVKIHRNYTIEEIAGLYQVHKNTVREWIKQGLHVCDSRKPMLILGRDLREFLHEKRTCNKQKCQPAEIYCVRCRKPQFPADAMADYVADTDKKGRLIALCPDCDGVMNTKNKGRAGWHQKAASNIASFIASYFACLSTHFKAFIVELVIWGLMPVEWADWINHQGEKDD